VIELPESELAWNVVFGAGSIERLPAALDKLGFANALLLSTPGRRLQVDEVDELLGARAALVFDQARPHVPRDVVDIAIDAAHSCHADCCISVGGGSTTGLGKALALEMQLPNIAVPTSYAGSEMTNIWGITENGRKTTGRDDSVLPVLTLYDPELTLSLPAAVAATSGMNALAQAAANIIEPDADRDALQMALNASALLASALPALVDRPYDIEPRTDALRGACLAGGALGIGVTSLHHRLCHIIGGHFGTDHAATHAILLPHTVAYNADAASENAAMLADYIGADSAATGLWQLAQRIDAPTELGSLGLREEEIETICELAMATEISNPRAVERDELLQLLQNAYDGVCPE
jgi:alcohol dehydrogenase class IV